MGGYGSSRWNHHYRACTVNESFSFDLASVDIRQRMEADEQTGYAYNWISNGKPSGSMGVFYLPDRQAIVFKFQATKGDTTKDVLQRIRLETTPLHFGGVRYWMRCPHCNKRVRTLHLPPSAVLNNNPFRCRTCYNLSYFSSQESRHPRGYLYELLNISDKADNLNRKLRRCRRGSKNYIRLSKQISKLYAHYDALLTLNEQKSTQMRANIDQLLTTMG